MKRQKPFDALKFHDKGFVNYNVHAVSTIQFDSLVDDGQWDLAPKGQIMRFQLVT